MYRSGISSLVYMKDIRNSPRVFWIKPFSPFYETFKEKIELLISNGVVFHWWDKFLNPKGFKRIEDDIGPQVLTYEHLEIGFMVCLVPLSLSVVAFVFEAIKSFIH